MKIGDGDSNTIFTSKASQESSSSSRPLQCEPVCAVRVCVCVCVCAIAEKNSIDFNLISKDGLTVGNRACSKVSVP